MLKSLTTIVSSSLVMVAVAVAGPVVGQKAPDFSAATTMDKTFSLAAQQGKRVVLEWSNHDCPFVVKHYGGNMQATQKKTIADGTVWVTIISSAPGEQGHVTAAQANDLTESRDAAPTHVILDESGEIGRLYDAKTTPHMFVIDEEGVLQYAGAIDSIPTANVADIARSDNYVLSAIASLRAGQPVVTRQSQPYGCSVKYKS